MNVLLTGGAGYIGSHTAIELIEKGCSVVLADDFSNSGAEVVTRMEKLTGRAIPAYQLDVADRCALERVFDERAIDAVIHFAGYKAVGESVARPVKYYRNNLDTTLTLLEVMGERGVNSIIFSSSATVYGEPDSVPLTEEAPAGACMSPYGRTKYFIEQILTDAAAANPALSVVILRYFNPIGAHESGLLGELPNGIPNNLMPYIMQTAAGLRESLNVFGNDYPTRDGTGIRDYIHVTDLARGHVAALSYAAEHRGAGIFNLGTGKGSTVLEIVAAFESATGVKIPYVIAPRRPGDIAEYWADPGKAERLLGWRAEKSLEDMCRDSWRWQQTLGK